MPLLGLKILRADGSSLTDHYGRVTYPVGEWVTVPGFGAFVATDPGDGLTSGGLGPLLVAMECEEPTGSPAPDGVVCYRRVRRLAHGCDFAPARAERNRVCAQARAEYDRVCAQAWAEYERVCAPARAEYDRVCAQAWAEMIARATGR